MDADEVQMILDVLNAWTDSDLDRLRAEHADLRAQVLARLPPVIPVRRTEARPHGMRQTTTPQYGP